MIKVIFFMLKPALIIELCLSARLSHYGSEHPREEGWAGSAGVEELDCARDDVPLRPDIALPLTRPVCLRLQGGKPHNL